MIDDFYTQTARVEQPSETQTDMGGQAKAWATRIPSLKCRAKRKDFRETDEYGKVTLMSGVRLYCAATATNRAIDPNDRVILGGSTFEIKGRPYNPGGLNRHLELELVEVK